MEGGVARAPRRLSVTRGHRRLQSQISTPPRGFGVSSAGGRWIWVTGTSPGKFTNCAANSQTRWRLEQIYGFAADQRRVTGGGFGASPDSRRVFRANRAWIR
eukprot:8165236-Pyramimonas_sp.AAC.1